MRADAPAPPWGARVASSAWFLAAAAVVAVLLVAVGNALPAGHSLTAAVTVLGAATLVSVLGCLGGVAGRVTAAVLLVMTGGRRRPRALAPVPVRQQDPTTPGRPQPRAPGAAPLPSTA